MIGCIIQLDRHDGKRKVVDIVFPMRDMQRKNAIEERQEKARLDEIEELLNSKKAGNSDI